MWKGLKLQYCICDVLFLFVVLAALGYSKSLVLDLVFQTAIYGLLDWEI